MMVKTELMKETLARGYTLRFRALGGSMLPLIRSGSLLCVKPISADSANIGDVLFVQTERGFLVHRLIKKADIDGENIFITKGDYVLKSDPPCKTEQILGKIVTMEKNKKLVRLDSALFRWLGRILAALSPNFLYPFLNISFAIVRPLLYAGRYMRRRSKQSDERFAP